MSEQSNFSLDDKKIYLILALACFLAFSNSLSGNFVFDDTQQIVENPAIRSWNNIVNAFTTDVWAFRQAVDSQTVPPPYYRPFFTAFLTIGYQFFGLWQQGWHLFNLAIHIGATILVYTFLLRLSDTNRRLSFVGSLLFALIPVHVESVTWISGNPDALATLFFIPSALAFLNWRESNNIKYLIASLILFLGALLCKETPIVLPFILFCWEIIRNKENFSFSNLFNAGKKVLFFLIPITVYLAMRFSVLGKISWKHPMIDNTATELIYATIPSVFVTYLKNIIFPFNLSLIYNTRFVSGFGDTLLWIPVLILIGLAFVVYTLRKHFTKQMWMALILFIVPLLPVLNLKVFHYEYIVQDRYLYIPSIGFVWFVACLIEKLWTSEKEIYKKFAPAVVGVLCFSYLLGTVWHNRVWTSEVNLWSRAIEVKPNNWAAHYNLGLAYLLEKNYESAQINFDKALEFPFSNRRDELIYVNRGLTKKELNKPEDARTDFLKALEFEPKSAEALTNLGVLEYEQQNYSEAEKWLQKAYQLNSVAPPIQFNLARTAAKLGKDKEALNLYEKLFKVRFSDPELMYYAAISYYKTGQSELARKMLIDAERLTTQQSLKDQIREELEKIK